MSVRKLPRQLGAVLSCSGVKGRPNCTAKLQTGQVEARGIRAYAKTLLWGRGLRKGHKRNDLCSDCMSIEQRLFAEEQAKREADKAALDEKRKALWAAKGMEPPPPKPRKRKQVTTTLSPLAASAPALAT